MHPFKNSWTLFVFTIFLGVFTIKSFGSDSSEQPLIDSLNNVIETTTEDTVRVRSLAKLSDMVYMSDPMLDLEINNKIQTICTNKLSSEISETEAKIYRRSLASSLGILAGFKQQSGDYNTAVHYLKEGIKLCGELNDSTSIGKYQNNIGLVYQYEGKYGVAADHFRISIQIKEALKDSIGLAGALNNLGMLYAGIKDHEKAYDLFLKAIDLSEKMNDQRVLSISLTNMAIELTNNEEYEKATDYLDRALEIDRVLDHKQGIAKILNNYAKIYGSIKQHQRALDTLKKSIQIQESISDVKGVIIALVHMADNYRELGNLQTASLHAERAATLAKEINSLPEISFTAKTQYEIYEELNQKDKALKAYKNYITTRDSLQSKKKQKEVIRQEYKYEYDKKMAMDSIENAKVIAIKDLKVEKQKSEISQKKYQLYFLIALVLLLITISGVTMLRFKYVKIQNELIEKQKKLDMSLVVADNKMRKEFNEGLLAKLQEISSLSGDKLKGAIRSFQTDIKGQLIIEDRLEHVSDNLQEFHSQFEQTLSSQYPTLTKSEREICHLIRLNMSIKEIANHKQTTIGAIKTVRYRLKSKLEIGEESLDTFVKKM